MFRVSRSGSRALAAMLAAVAIAACAPAPLYRTNPSGVTATPVQVAASPQAFEGRHVVWGGTVVSVRNLPHSSEIQVLAYPLDASQHPRLKQPAIGRFIAEVPGFVEPLNYPPGAPVTLQGTLAGARRALVGQADYDFAIVRSDALHRWTAEEMTQGHPNIHFGVGVGTWIR